MALHFSFTPKKKQNDIKSIGGSQAAENINRNFDSLVIDFKAFISMRVTSQSRRYARHPVVSSKK